MKKILKFYSKTCGPCKVVGNNLVEVTKTTGVEVQEIDVTDKSNNELIRKYNIMMIPTVVIINGDNTQIFKGINPVHMMIDALNE